MASQGGTRYEDRTMVRGGGSSVAVAHNNSHTYSVSHLQQSLQVRRSRCCQNRLSYAIKTHLKAPKFPYTAFLCVFMA